MARVGQEVTVFVEGEMPTAGVVDEIGLGTVRIAWNRAATGAAVQCWFHDLEAGRRPGLMMGDPLNRAKFELR